MVKIDGSVFIQIVNFLVLIWILNIVLYRPIRNMLLQRREKVSGLEGTIEDANAQMTEKDEAFSRGIKEARAKGLREKESLIKEGEAEEKEIVGRINEKAQAELAQVKDKIAQEAQEVRDTLMKEVDAFASDIGQKILGRAV
jgi:F-type H+-transporting ATPase subunit b